MKKDKLIVIILLLLILVLLIYIYKYNLIKKFNSFAIENLETFYLKSDKYNIATNELYNSVSVYKSNEDWHYIINDKEIYFNEKDSNMTVIINDEEIIQEKFDLSNMVQIYSTYLNWSEKTFFEKIKYICFVDIKKTKYRDVEVYKIVDNDTEWYINQNDYSPVELKSTNTYTDFEYRVK